MKIEPPTKTSTRPYRQGARAAATAETQAAILTTYQQMFLEEARFDVSLDEVAARVGVTTRTVLRHFGSKEGLVSAALEDALKQNKTRRHVTPGDVKTAITVLVKSYETTGPQMLRLLAAAESNPAIGHIADAGKRWHVEWVQQAFGPCLQDRSLADQHTALIKLATVTDLYVWSLMRQRFQQSREQTEQALLDLVTGILSSQQ